LKEVDEAQHFSGCGGKENIPDLLLPKFESALLDHI
jgi:hypothetical protein